MPFDAIGTSEGYEVKKILLIPFDPGGIQSQDKSPKRYDNWSITGLILGMLKVYAGLFEVDAFIGSSLVDMFVKCGPLLHAWKVFFSIQIQNVAQRNALIVVFVKCGHGGNAFQIFKKMPMRGISSNVVTFTYVLKASGSIKMLEQGHEVHDYVLKFDLLDHDMIVGTTLVDMYTNSLEEAQKVFNRIGDQNVVSWTDLIGGYAKLGQCKEACLGGLTCGLVKVEIFSVPLRELPTCLHIISWSRGHLDSPHIHADGEQTNEFKM
ncbi:hypothetical protein GOP47_0021164 [Adiantum capillus-veneris]|uniref:Pentatricopeptide repeat-containing protein n=1 Tax=Adiantum capillus-veneris TaxID=13818 RepID=A0A9D4Z7M7_ADICA|nr:hypothetical protein GOP47_0021164 [Adiantum capillus-veneris]